MNDADHWEGIGGTAVDEQNTLTNWKRDQM